MKFVHAILAVIVFITMIFNVSSTLITTDSGLKYKKLIEGTGSASPSRSDRVKVHYRGTLANGTEFDSSYKRGQPAVFPVSGVIPGFSEGLQLMKVNDKVELHIPSNLGYGARGAGGVIPPNSDLIFEVELLEIVGHNEL